MTTTLLTFYKLFHSPNLGPLDDRCSHQPCLAHLPLEPWSEPALSIAGSWTSEAPILGPE